MRTYRTEFPTFDPATMPAIPATWLDTSWHNDTCPSFQCGALRIFVDYAEPEHREIAETPRYSVHLWEGDYPVLLVSDDWAEVLAFVAATLEAKASAICEAQPGYGTPAYRGDPYEAVALQQQAAATLGGAA
jgi:hypothetical protein